MVEGGTVGLELRSELLVDGGAGGLLGLWVCDGGFVVMVALWVCLWWFAVDCGGGYALAVSLLFLNFYFYFYFLFIYLFSFYVAPNTIKYFQTIF